MIEKVDEDTHHVERARVKKGETRWRLSSFPRFNLSHRSIRLLNLAINIQPADDDVKLILSKVDN